jgi:hypothetical protein
VFVVVELVEAVSAMISGSSVDEAVMLGSSSVSKTTS